MLVTMKAERSSQVDSSGRGARTAAILAAFGLAGIGLFQAALALGAPWGHAAWGGADAQLATPQRVGSGIAVVVWSLAALVVLECAGLRRGSKPHALARRGTWLIATVCGVSALANFASQSTYENVVFGPLALVLAVLCGVVAWSAGRRSGSSVRAWSWHP
jgi:hypothetical protein